MTLTLYPVMIVLSGHWVGDYLLHFDRMANEKGMGLFWLTFHALVYTLILLLVSFFLFSPDAAVYFSLFNGLLHFITDLAMTKLATRFKPNPKVYSPLLGLDQLIHTVTLMVTMGWVYGGEVYAGC